jgi:hypothetical protein
MGARKSRAAVSDEQRIADADSALVRYNDDPLRDTQKVDDKTTAGREAVWEMWTL